METTNNHHDLEACLRTFKRIAFKIDEMNTKLTHIIEDLREIYLKDKYQIPDPMDKFWQYYEKHDQPEDEDHEPNDDYQ